MTGMTDEVAEGLAQMLEAMAAEVRRRRPVQGSMCTSAHVIELPIDKPFIERTSGGLAKFEASIEWDVDPERAGMGKVVHPPLAAEGGT